MMASRATSVVTWRTPGTVTDRNLCHHDAPSTFAASYSSFGTLCSAARYSRMKMPSPFQVTYIAIDGIAQCWLISQDGLGASGPSMLLAIPPELNMNSHTPTVATLAVTYGTKKLVRKKARNGITALSAVARISDSITVSGTLMTRKIAMLRNAWRTAGSSNTAS